MDVRVSGNEPRTSFANAGGCSELQDHSEPRWFGLLCHHLWPTKPWLMLMQRAGLKERTAHNYAGGSTPPPATVLVALLRSVEGYRVLAAIVEPSSPTWWLELQRHRSIGAKVESVVQQHE